MKVVTCDVSWRKLSFWKFVRSVLLEGLYPNCKYNVAFMSHYFIGNCFISAYQLHVF